MEVGPGTYRAESNGEVVYALDCGGAHALVDVGGEAGLDAKLGQLEADAGIARDLENFFQSADIVRFQVSRRIGR